jgi:hypothetical protein
MNKELNQTLDKWIEEETLKLPMETLELFSGPDSWAVSEMVAALVVERVRAKAEQDDSFRELLPKRWRNNLATLKEDLADEIFYENEMEKISIEDAIS